MFFFLLINCHVNQWLFIFDWPSDFINLALNVFLLFFSLWAFLNFCTLSFIGIFIKKYFFHVTSFFPNYYWLLGSWTFGSNFDWYSLGCAASMQLVTKFLYSLFGVCISNVSWRISKTFLTITIHWLLILLLVSQELLYYEAFLVCFLFLSRLRLIFPETIL